MKILITGSTGFVGRYITNVLIDKYTLVLPVRNFQKAKNVLNLNKKAKLISFTENLDEIVINEKPDVIINLLGILKEDRKNNMTYEKVHYVFTQRLVDGALKASSVKHFVQMSALGASISSKSRYFKTKAAAENYIKSVKLKYSIFRPSIIMGKEQLLFKQFKQLSKVSPFFIAPKGKVQPVHILDVRDCIIKVVENFQRNNIYELCGNKVVTYKELFKFVLEYLGIRRPVIEVDKMLLLPVALLGNFVDQLPLNYEQWLMLEKDNVCSGKYPGVKSLLKSIRNPFEL